MPSPMDFAPQVKEAMDAGDTPRARQIIDENDSTGFLSGIFDRLSGGDMMQGILDAPGKGFAEALDREKANFSADIGGPDAGYGQGPRASTPEDIIQGAIEKTISNRDAARELASQSDYSSSDRNWVNNIWTQTLDSFVPDEPKEPFIDPRVDPSNTADFDLGGADEQGQSDQQISGSPRRDDPNSKFSGAPSVNAEDTAGFGPRDKWNAVFRPGERDIKKRSWSGGVELGRKGGTGVELGRKGGTGVELGRKGGTGVELGRKGGTGVDLGDTAGFIPTKEPVTTGFGPGDAQNAVFRPGERAGFITDKDSRVTPAIKRERIAAEKSKRGIKGNFNNLEDLYIKIVEHLEMSGVKLKNRTTHINKNGLATGNFQIQPETAKTNARRFLWSLGKEDMLKKENYTNSPEVPQYIKDVMGSTDNVKLSVILSKMTREEQKELTLIQMYQGFGSDDIIKKFFETKDVRVLVDLWAKVHKVIILDKEKNTIERRMRELKIKLTKNERT